MPTHDTIVAAFLRAGALPECHRGGEPGYTHIHGPSHPRDPRRCDNHRIVVERYNGTVAFRGELALAINAEERPPEKIQMAPLGYSYREHYGAFGRALTAAAILRRWPTEDDFAVEVIRLCRQTGTW